ncbi:MAG: hypothetical protein BWY93_01576 [Euryarchaeota archaeon ADurb.BinA087]|nr:MAG: hypothetical protein BWY93_01576 [Euryarchaeota archaeon ADurb.BinA087]
MEGCISRSCLKRSVGEYRIQAFGQAGAVFLAFYSSLGKDPKKRWLSGEGLFGTETGRIFVPAHLPARFSHV